MKGRGLQSCQCFHARKSRNTLANCDYSTSVLSKFVATTFICDQIGPSLCLSTFVCVPLPWFSVFVQMMHCISEIHKLCQLLSSRDAHASSSEGEEKKPEDSASASGRSMPEMSADSKQMVHAIISLNNNIT